jgi:hypothetical protein
MEGVEDCLFDTKVVVFGYSGGLLPPLMVPPVSTLSLLLLFSLLLVSADVLVV